MARPSSLLLTAIPVVSNLISLILLCLIIFSGINNRVTQLHWLSISTTNFTLPSSLSTSSFLIALTSLSKTDFSGPPALSASALSLPDHSTIHLLTTCTIASCTTPATPPPLPPPLSTLLTLPTEFLSKYTATARALIVIYPTAAALSFLAILIPQAWTGWASLVAGLSALLVFASTIAAAVVFRQLANVLNDTAVGHGLVAGVGGGTLAAGFVAAALMGAAGAGYGYGVYFGGEKKGGDGGGMFGGVGKVDGGRYVQIQRQIQNEGQKGSRLDEDWAAPDEYSGGAGGGKTSAGPGSVPLVALGGNRQTRDMETAYEPYSDPRLG